MEMNNSMTWLVVTSILLSVLGVGLAAWRSGGIPGSISALVYDLPRNRRWVWILWVWAMSFTVGVPTLEAMNDSPWQFMAFLMLASMMFCGAMPLISGERNIPHYVAAMAAGATSQLCVMAVCAWWLLPWPVALILADAVLLIGGKWTDRMLRLIESHGVLVLEAVCALTLYGCIFLTF